MHTIYTPCPVNNEKPKPSQVSRKGNSSKKLTGLQIDLILLSQICKSFNAAVNGWRLSQILLNSSFTEEKGEIGEGKSNVFVGKLRI